MCVEKVGMGRKDRVDRSRHPRQVSTLQGAGKVVAGRFGTRESVRLCVSGREGSDGLSEYS